MSSRPSSLFSGHFALLLIVIGSQVKEIDSVVTVTKCASLETSETHLKIPESLQAPFPQQNRPNSNDGSVYTFILNSSIPTNNGDNSDDDQSSWRPGEEPCASEMKPAVFLPLNKTYALNLSNDPQSVLYRSQHYFAPSGYFYDNSTRLLHHPDNYCISRMTSDEMGVQFCLPVVNGRGRLDTDADDQSALNVTVVVPKPIRKCCPAGMVGTLVLNARGYVEVNPRCDFPPTRPSVNVTGPFQDWEARATDLKQKRHFNLLTELHFLQCRGYVRFYLGYEPSQNVKTSLHFQQVKILENGDVISRVSGNHQWVRHQTSCQDLYFGYGPNSEVSGPFGPQIVYCDEKSDELPVDSWFYFTSLLLSTAFLLATVIVYGLIWPKENVHGWTVACFAFSLFMNHFLGLTSWGLSIWITSDAYFEVTNSKGCILVAVLGHFFSIAMFTWMTLLNFDLWWAIGSMTAMAERSKGMTRFKVYCCVGFGLPTLVVSTSLLVEHLYGLFDDRVIRPQYGRARCVLDRSAVFYHFTLIAVMLFSLNIICGLLTLRTLWNFKKGTKMVEKSNSQNSRSSAVLFGKLFVIMGFTWVFSIGSSLVVGEEITWFKTIADVYNILQGTGVFWIFVCKRDVRDKLADSYTLFNDLFQWWDEKIGSKFSQEPKSAPSSSSAPSTKSSADA